LKGLSGKGFWGVDVTIRASLGKACDAIARALAA
jgi:hypothetical protein